MNHIEIMKQALDALEDCRDVLYQVAHGNAPCNDAEGILEPLPALIEALRKAMLLHVTEPMKAEVDRLRFRIAQQSAMVEKCMVAMNENADRGEKAEAKIAAMEKKKPVPQGREITTTRIANHLKKSKLGDISMYRNGFFDGAKWSTKEPRHEIAQPESEPTPPFGSKRAAAMAIYTPPFKFQYGYIYDSQNLMVADNGEIVGTQSVEGAIAARVRGWGRIGYMPDAKQLQDEIGMMMADALNALYAAPVPAYVPLTDDDIDVLGVHDLSDYPAMFQLVPWGNELKPYARKLARATERAVRGVK